MRSVKDIDVSEITEGKKYWNSERPIEEEIMYFLLIDRFHDAKARTTVQSTTGYGSLDSLQARCGGTIKGVTVNLPYIASLGFTSIWINPFLQNNPETYHGYSIENFLEVDTQWGTKEDIVELVAAAHARNIKVFFDVVLNHTGNNWSYVKHNPTYTKGKRFAVKSWRYDDKPVPVELRNLNLYNRKGSIVKWEETPETWEGDIFELKDLIQDDSLMGNMNLEIMLAIYTYWIALTDCDGFRIDAAKHIPPLWLNTFIDSIKIFTTSIQKNNFFIFAEIISTQGYINKYKAIDGYLDFDFHFSFVPAMLPGKKIQHRISTQAVSKIPIRFLDNHDQIGQKTKRRIGYNMHEKALCNVLRAFLLLPGLPCIYYGTEQGLTGRGVLDGAIRECLFDPAGNQDLLLPGSPYARVIREFTALRKKLGTYTGNLLNCAVTSPGHSRCIALQISTLDSDKVILYNLGPNNEQVSIKLYFPIPRTNKLVVYLYTDRDVDTTENVLVNDILQNINICPYGFMILELLTDQDAKTKQV